MNQWTLICRVDEIPMLGSRRVARPNAPTVALFRTVDNQVFALLDRCPHKHGRLSQGIVHGGAVACVRHPHVEIEPSRQGCGAGAAHDGAHMGLA